ncbi:hypothetical protein ACFX2B_031204 [Malus domestica]
MSAIRVDSAKPYFATSSLVIGYAFCSSLLAVINKFAITKFNYLGLLTALQYLTSALGVWGLGKSGFLHHNPFTWQTAKTFCPLHLCFTLLSLSTPIFFAMRMWIRLQCLDPARPFRLRWRILRLGSSQSHLSLPSYRC